MPMYRTAIGIVHMRGTKLPKPCVGSIWLDGKETSCAAVSGFLCDHPDGGGRTCDRPLCNAHARQVGKNRHFCPEHFTQQEQSSGQRGLFTGLIVSSPPEETP